jgi:hypothetical protein
MSANAAIAAAAHRHPIPILLFCIDRAPFYFFDLSIEPQDERYRHPQFGR